MCPTTPLGFEGLDAGEDESERGATRPERYRRRKLSARPKMSARRSRSNEMAKRGMHQRRNKRSAW
jgi:hypothetical protein